MGFENTEIILMPIPKIPFQSLAHAVNGSVFRGYGGAPIEIPSIGLVLHGSLAQRKCLIQILPHFQFHSTAENRSLILGKNELQDDAEGLKIRLGVSGDGNVRFVLLESSSGDTKLDSMALEAARQWQFAQDQGSLNSWQWGTVCLERESGL